MKLRKLIPGDWNMRRNKNCVRNASVKNLLLAAVVSMMPVVAGAAGGHGPELESMEVRLGDTRSLQNGANLFVNYCLSCHSAKYMRYGRMAEDLNIPTSLVEDNMIHGDAKIGDPMTTTMPEEKAAEWFGVAPPDLSLVGRLRGADWLYNYLTRFYVDENSVTGWNNLVFENAAMPHVLSHLQGRQRAVFKTESAEDGSETKVFEGFEMESEGSMDPEEFDHAMRDLTNFLVYMGEPAKLVRIKYGMFVMLFLLVFFALAYMLKREYWKDVDVSH